METASLQTRIPFVDLGGDGPAALAEYHRETAEALLHAGRQVVPYPFLPAMDRLSRRWAHRAENPHRAEIAALSASLPTGVWFMNLCFEWGCTTGVAAEPDGKGMRMLRTLDWPFHGIGRHVVVARQTGPAGDYLNITWPGFVGVVTAMAPGRFALAINQAPLVRRGYLPLPADWLANRVAVFRSRELPPVHLARRIMETCRNYDEARETIERTPLALPAIFTLAGVARGAGCVIERTQTRAWTHTAPAATANHWLSRGLKGHPRGIDSRRRLRLMNGLCRQKSDGFKWLIAPVLNPDTRLAVVANPASGRLRVQGWERDGAATEVYDHGAGA
jgi:hypothetical protein